MNKANAIDGGFWLIPRMAHSLLQRQVTVPEICFAVVEERLHMFSKKLELKKEPPESFLGRWSPAISGGKEKCYHFLFVLGEDCR